MIRQPLVIIPPHSRQRLRLRGNGCSMADVRKRVVRACQCPEAAFGKRLALVGGDVVPIIEVKQHSSGQILSLGELRLGIRRVPWRLDAVLVGQPAQDGHSGTSGIGG